jgi:hypothetical protein
MVEFLVLALAVWRVSRLIVQEEGPFSAFERIRHRLGVDRQETWWHRGLACVGCISFWLGQAVAFCLLGATAYSVCYGLALSAVAVVLMRKVN